MTISFVIVTYFSRQLISDCLESIFFFNDISESSFEIIVVDNSGPEEFHKLKNLLHKSFPNRVNLIENKNGGYGQGNNVGISAAKGEIIGIMNPDVRLVEPLLSTVLHTYETDSKIGILAFKQIGGSDLSFYHRPEFEIPLISSLNIKTLNKKNSFNPSKHFLSGAFFFISKELFESSGKFDENIFMYYEESDIARRMSHYKSVFLPEKKYLHLIDDRIGMSNISYMYSLKSLTYYLDKYNLNKMKVFYYKCLENKLKSIIYKILGNKEKSEIFKNYNKLLYDNKSLFT